jgi:hypothetical protein
MLCDLNSNAIPVIFFILLCYFETGPEGPELED